MRRGQLHRLTIGRTREVRGPDAIELAAAGVIAVAAMIIAIGFGVRHIQMVRTLEAVALSAGAGGNYDQIVYRSLHGAWPSPHHGMVGDKGGGLSARNLSLDPGGGITVELVLQPFPAIGPWGAAIGGREISGLLSFRPELLGTQELPAFTLLCGYAAPIAGLDSGVQAANRTTLDRKELPPFCR